MRILHTCKSTNNGKFRDMSEKDAGGGRETGNLFGVALDSDDVGCMHDAIYVWLHDMTVQIKS